MYRAWRFFGAGPSCAGAFQICRTAILKRDGPGQEPKQHFKLTVRVLAQVLGPSTAHGGPYRPNARGTLIGETHDHTASIRGVSLEDDVA